ncbi:MAG: glycosyltransferase family 4 protein [bacterium]|nr:glycosyltransferase family 4 protein [bacterium]
MMVTKLSQLPLNSSVALYGAGAAGSSFRKLLEENRPDIRVKFFIDSFQGGQKDNLEIVEWKLFQQYKDRVDSILVTSTAWKEIEKNLEVSGVSNYKVVSPDLLEKGNKKPRRGNRLTKLPATLLDILLSVPCFLWLLLRMVRFRLFSIKPKGKRNILRLHEGGDLESIYRKYGDFETFYQLTIDDFFDLYIGSDYKTRNSFLIRLREDFYKLETKYFKHFPLLSAFYFLTRNVSAASKHRISLVHASSPYMIGLLGYVVSLVSRLPFCVSLHADYEKREELQGNVIPRILNSLNLSRKVERFIYKKAALVLTIRESMKFHVVESGCDPFKIRIFPHGIDLGAFEGELDPDTKQRFGVPGDGRVISSVGRLEKENYCHDLIEIALRGAVEQQDSYYVICGGGSQLETLRQRVNENNLAHRIFLPGEVSHEDAIALRRVSDVNLCLMGGFSLIEACAAGKPVIAYDVEWHYELVKNGETGFLVPEHDVRRLTDRVRFLLEHPADAQKMGQKAKQLAMEKHAKANTDETKKKIYRELLELTDGNERKQRKRRDLAL